MNQGDEVREIEKGEKLTKKRDDEKVSGAIGVLALLLHMPNVQGIH